MFGHHRQPIETPTNIVGDRIQVDFDRPRKTQHGSLSTRANTIRNGASSTSRADPNPNPGAEDELIASIQLSRLLADQSERPSHSSHDLAAGLP